MMTDAEWQDLQETAAAAGMRVSAYIIHRLAATSGDSDDARIDDTLACLEEIERLRLVEEPETWNTINERVDARLVPERRLSR